MTVLSRYARNYASSTNMGLATVGWMSVA